RMAPRCRVRTPSSQSCVAIYRRVSPAMTGRHRPSGAVPAVFLHRRAILRPTRCQTANRYTFIGGSPKQESSALMMPTSDVVRAPRDAAHPMMRVRPAEIHLRDRLSIFYRYRYLAALAFVVVFAGAAFYAYSQTPLYRATARLLIELEDERSLTMEG